MIPSGKKPVIDVVIPVWNEAESITKVLGDIPVNLVRHIIVCDNGSTDNTAQKAIEAGAVVVREPRKGYGAACLKGMEFIRNLSQKPDVVVFLDGDYSDHPEEMHQIVLPIIENNIDLVIGSRATGNKEKGSMMPQQVFGNKLATLLIRWLYRYEFSDLGPFRAISYPALEKINMQDKNFGWTVEMQVKAAKLNLRTCEVPVSYRRRIGISKVSGTLKGSLLAGHKIIWTIFKNL